MIKTVIVTGGLGYIGSHTVVELLCEGHNVIVLDNCSSIGLEHGKSVFKILAGIAGVRKVSFCWHCVDITNYSDLKDLRLEADWIIHFAAFKNVGESCQKPLEYYSNNLGGLMNMLRLCRDIGCFNFIFSSSATVYSHELAVPFSENAANGRPTKHPYGNTKIIGEQILKDLVAADAGAEGAQWNIVILRYFNPVGAHPTGLLGEKYIEGRANNLFPAILGAHITGKPITVFGNTYNTCDGTCVRDYIHVVDLACAHTLSIDRMDGGHGLHIYNVGLGEGKSVMEVISEFERRGFEFKWQIGEKREGDAEASYCDNTRILTELGWKPKYDLKDMVAHTLAFLKKIM